jgi:hypothetical protein
MAEMPSARPRREGARVIDEEEMPVAVVQQVALVAVDVGDELIEELHAAHLLRPLRFGPLRRFVLVPAGRVLDPVDRRADLALDRAFDDRRHHAHAEQRSR